MRAPALLTLAAAAAVAAGRGGSAAPVGAPGGPLSWRTFGADSACGQATPALRGGVGENASSVEACKALCQQAPGDACKGIEYSASTGRCSLVREAVRVTRASQGSECWSLLAEQVKVFVMLPLTTVSLAGEISDPAGLTHMLDRMQWAGVDGFMVDVWWGLTEAKPKVYNFTAYKELFKMAKQRGWKVEVVASFHRCGGNVGDECDINLPAFVRNEEGIWYTDAQGNEDREYISLFADNVAVGGRTPLQMYRDWMEAFASEFAEDLGPVISEVEVGMGPCGELRYPSYPLSRWQFCGVGQFQASDPHALASLRAAAEEAARPEWSAPPGAESAGTYNSRPWETEFFSAGFQSDYGKFFLDWYFSSLKAHGDRLLATASAVFKGKAEIAGKIAGIHWWYDSDSHAAEATAGYYNTNFRNAYAEIADVFSAHSANLDFTCLEMRNYEQPGECKSNPEGLVQQALLAAAEKAVVFSGENALQRYDEWAYEKMASYKEHLAAITFLRLNDVLIKEDNLARFASFVAKLHSADSPLALPTPGAKAMSEAAAGVEGPQRLRR